MDTNKLISGCKVNDRVSQENLYRHYFQTMMVMCLRYIDDRQKAASVVNEGFLKVFLNIDQYEHRGSFEGWIRRIVFRCLSDHIRKETNYLKFMVFEEYERPAADTVLSKLYEEDILKLIKHIPAASGEVFIQYAINGYTHKEIAEMRDISIGTSKWHLSEARKKLQELILKTDTNRNAG